MTWPAAAGSNAVWMGAAGGAGNKLVVLRLWRRAAEMYCLRSVTDGAWLLFDCLVNARLARRA